MTSQHMEIAEAGRLWAIRVRDSAFDDWDGLTAWLEESPEHAAVYDAAIELDAWTEDLFRHEPPKTHSVDPIPFRRPEPQSAPRKRWYAMGGAIAAAIVGVITFSMFGFGGDEIVTAPGEQRTIPLADGSRIILNGGTRITMDSDNPREIELAAGEVLFDVRHDEKSPFVVTMADGTRLVDAGTVFNVVSDDDTLDVAVAEGEVIYAPGKQEIRLKAGDALSRASGKAHPVLRKASPPAIGGWQRGQLEYADATLDKVARDLSRNLGRPIRAADGAEYQRFTGTLVVRGTAQDVLERASPLLGVEFTPDGEAWRMTPTHGAPAF